MSFLFAGLLSTAQVNEAQQTKKFNVIDGDGNEVITIREMVKYYEGKTDKEDEPIDAKKLFYGLDANKNSIVTLNEFVKGIDWKLAYEFVDKWEKKPDLSEPKPNSKSDMVAERQTKQFIKIDANEDEKLTLIELVNYHKGMINKKTGKPINGKLKFYAYDYNDNDVITIDEYLEKPDYSRGSKKLKDLNSGNGTSDSGSPSNNYINKRINLFYEVDIDSNYKVTVDEMINYYKGKVKNNGIPINGELRYYGLDTNKDGYIELEEFTKKIDFKAASKRMKESKNEGK